MKRSTVFRRRRAAVLLCPVILMAVAGGLQGEEAGGISEPAGSPMGYLEAAALGVVEGLTEYLPVSSTGHLILAQRLLGIPVETEAQKQAADAFAVCIQAGAILAVLGLYWRHVRQMGRGLLGRNPAGARMLICLGVGFLPAAVVGLALNDYIKQYLFGLWPIVAAWAAGGVAILLTAGIWRTKEKNASGAARRTLEQMTWKMALAIGLFQCLAMWPGTSRALVTILAGLLVGLELAAAVEFSFLLGVVTLGAATGYDTLKHGERMLEVYHLGPLVVGTLAAFVSAVVAVKWMVGYLQRHDLKLFGWYRLGLAAGVAALLLAGWMKN